MANTRKTTASMPRQLLEWYDKHGRKLPWRIHKGRAPSPYHTWLSEIMLQQTTVAAVTAYYHRFVARWPDIASLAAANEDDVLGEWAGLGYYSRARNLLKCAQMVVAEYGGEFPSDIKSLLNLPGIGDYTANAIRAIAFGIPANVVDGNVERVMARVFAYDAPINTPKGKTALKQFAATLAPDERAGDYAQALMDLGATICTPRKPACPLCPWQHSCQAYATGLTETLPIVIRKAKPPVRHAVSFVMRDERGRIFLQQRPSSGLLGGLWVFPGSPIEKNSLDDPGNDPDIHAPLPLTEFNKLTVSIVHVFTHFKLVMDVFVLAKPIISSQKPDIPGRWFAADDLPALPTITKKILAAIPSSFGDLP